METPMTRAEQARAEAERQIHVYGDDFRSRTLQADLNDAFVQGVEWADANPQPHTITREALGRIGYIARGRFLTPHDLEWYLGGIGIEVEDNDDAR